MRPKTGAGTKGKKSQLAPSAVEPSLVTAEPDGVPNELANDRITAEEVSDVGADAQKASALSPSPLHLLPGQGSAVCVCTTVDAAVGARGRVGRQLRSHRARHTHRGPGTGAHPAS